MKRRRRMVQYTVRELGPEQLHELDPCPRCGRPLIDPCADHPPAAEQLLGALSCPACRIYYVAPAD